MHGRLTEYTYTQRQTTRAPGLMSSTEVVTYEAYPVVGHHVLIRTHINGVLIPSRDLNDQRAYATRRLEEAHALASKHAAARGHHAGQPGGHMSVAIERGTTAKRHAVVLSLSDFLRSCRFRVSQYSVSGGRDIILLEFDPTPDAKLVATKSYIGKLKGKLWIDVAEAAVVRLEGWVAAEFIPRKHAERSRTARQEPNILFEQMRVGDGLWFPKTFRLDSLGFAPIFNNVDWDVRIDFSDYKRFSTEDKGYEYDGAEMRR